MVDWGVELEASYPDAVNHGQNPAVKAKTMALLTLADNGKP